MVTDPSDFRERHLRKSDFLGVFGVLERPTGVLMVRNRRRIGGAHVDTWDLPGGQVEAGETLLEALARELAEEVRVVVRGEPRFLFLQEGVKFAGTRRSYAWRSFFFAVEEFDGEPRAGAEILDTEWVPRTAVPDRRNAPYHDSFTDWLRGDGGPIHFFCEWREAD